MLAFELNRIPSGLEFSSKPWMYMRVVVLQQRNAAAPVDVYVMDGVRFSERDPRSWASYMLCYDDHARPVVAPERYRGVAGSAALMQECARAKLRVVCQRAVPWADLVGDKGRTAVAVRRTVAVTSRAAARAASRVGRAHRASAALRDMPAPSPSGGAKGEGARRKCRPPTRHW